MQEGEGMHPFSHGMAEQLPAQGIKQPGTIGRMLIDTTNILQTFDESQRVQRDMCRAQYGQRHRYGAVVQI